MMNRMVFYLAVLIGIIFSIQIGCKKDIPKELPSLVTINVTDITYTSITSGGMIFSAGGVPVLSRGICLSTNKNPEISDTKTVDGAGTGSFASTISALMAGTTYYIRAYATNNVGTSYGNQYVITTTAPRISLTTTAISSINSTTAVSGGIITSDEGAVFTARGVCWSTTTGPTIANNLTSDGTGSGIFISAITGLTEATTYYVRAYATTNLGTTYGNEVTFTTTANIPTLTTTSITAVTQTTASGGGNITLDGGSGVTVRGVCWSTISGPTTASSKTSDGTGTGIFTSAITGLTEATTYYVRAYATNSAGTSYGNEVTFKTICNLPTAPGTITGSTSIVQNATGIVYSIAAVTGATSYTWIVPAGATIVSGRGTTTIEVNFGTTGGNVSVRAENTCGNSTYTDLTVSTCLIPAAPGAITGSTTVAQNTTGIVYSILSVIGATSYNWTVPAGATIVSGQGTTSITMNFGTTGGNVSVRTENNCGNSTYTNLAVAMCLIPQAPGSITGSTIFIQNATGIAYSISAVTGATNYTWTVPAEATIISGQGTTSIVVNFGTTGGNISVRAENSCGNSLYTNLAVATCQVPAAPGTISGSTTIALNATGTVYYISAVTGATRYNWTVPEGAIIVSGQGTTTITVNFGTMGGNVSVRSESACGFSSNTNLAVSTCQVPAAPGAITGSTIVAQNATGIIYSISAVAGATNYRWTVSFGVTIVSGQGTTSITVNFGTTGGNISVRAENSCGNSLYTNLIVTAAANLPTLTTIDIICSSITSTTAIGGGIITSDGGATVTARGVCWNTIPGPTIANSITTDGTGTGNFTSLIPGLTTGTTYYVRAYATNSAGTAYGNEVSFTTTPASFPNCGTVTDIDGNVYNTVTIGTRCWMAENLKTTKYRNGDPIPNITDNTAWVALTTGGYCWYDNNAATNKATYGALYNWFSVSDSRQLCPTGWHVSADEEWTTLTTFLGGEDAAGGMLKERCFNHWYSPNTGATNSSGFTALPGGYRTINGSFYNIGYLSYWWSSTERNSSNAWFRLVLYNVSSVTWGPLTKPVGLSVRCIRDL